MTAIFWPGTTIPKSQNNAFTQSSTGEVLRSLTLSESRKRNAAAKALPAPLPGSKVFNAAGHLQAPLASNKRNSISIDPNPQASNDRRAAIQRGGI